MELTNNSLEKISAKVVKITKSLEFTQKKTEELLKPCKKGRIKIKSEMKQLAEDAVEPNLLSDKLIKLENRSRGNNFKYNLNVENLINIVGPHSMGK